MLDCRNNDVSVGDTVVFPDNVSRSMYRLVFGVV
jgi:hypothetical protein